MHIDDALGRYVTQLRANGRSEHTVLQLQRHVRLLASWLAQEQRPAELDRIDEDTLAAFLTSAVARTTATGAAKSAGTLNALRGSLKSFFAHAARARWIARDPALLIRRAICSPPPPRALSAKEEERLRAALDAGEGFEAERDRVLILLMIGSGIRLSSALGLDVDDVDLDGGALLLRKVKGGRVERVLLAPSVRELLAGFLEGRGPGPVFGNAAGRRLSLRHAQRRIRTWRDVSGLSSAVSAHTFRHTHGQRVYDATHDILIVKAALGHRSISSSLIYARAGEDRLRAVLAGQLPVKA